jgi:dimethylhistidine N-methyltransferase
MSGTQVVTPQALRRSDQTTWLERFAADVRHGLTVQPRQLPSRYLYDDLGSALFDAICLLPWYPITRAERRLLAADRRAITRHAAPLGTIVELGTGNGEKLRTLLAATDGTDELAVHLVDLSGAALAATARALDAFDHVRVTPHRASYEAGLQEAAGSFPATGRALVLFLGSNIGNFDPSASDAFLGSVRRALRAGDLLLLGADLVKAPRMMELAYDDPLGVTAAFNRNLLVRVNRELEGNFDVDRFAHRAVWNESASRMEMHLVARTRQRVAVRAAGVELVIAEGETIWTESSYKYRVDEIGRMLRASGFEVRDQWIDAGDAFALTLAEAA